MNYNVSQQPTMSPAVLVIVCCILCTILTSASNMCPEEYKGICMSIASVINGLLCLFVVATMFGVF